MDQLIAGGASAPVDVTMDNFMAEVIEASATTPTLVQFWAPWCGPCKQLGPVLEKVVGASGGKVRMVRVNIDDNAQIAQQMRVQSVPTVYGFVDGKPVDAFAGAQPESAVKEFVDKLSGMGGGGADTAAMLEAAEAAFAAGDPETVETTAEEERETEVTSNPIRKDETSQRFSETSQRFSFIRVDQSRATADPVSALYSSSALEINKLTTDMKRVTRRMFLNADERTLEM